MHFEIESTFNNSLTETLDALFRKTSAIRLALVSVPRWVLRRDLQSGQHITTPARVVSGTSAYDRFQLQPYSTMSLFGRVGEGP
jgi:hypothetical protein